MKKTYIVYSMKYRIIPAYECLVISGQEQIFLQEGEILEFDNPVLLSIYPTQNNRINYAFNLNLASTSESVRYQVVQHDNQVDYFLTNGISCENFIIVPVTINDNICKLELSENRVTIKYKQHKKKINLASKFTKYKTGILSNCVYCLLTCTAKENLIIFDTISGKVTSLNGDEIKINTNNIVLTENIDNVARHVIQTEYVITAEGLTETSKQISYQAGRPVIVTIPQTMPYAFLEAISVQDTELAFSYLDISMKRKVDSQHLLAYFGQIQNFHAIDTKTYLVNTTESKKIYKFITNDNKITEIYQPDDNLKEFN